MWETAPGSHEGSFCDAWIQRALAAMGFKFDAPDLGAVGC